MGEPFSGNRGIVPEPQRGEPTLRNRFLRQVQTRLGQLGSIDQYSGDLSDYIVAPQVKLDYSLQSVFRDHNGPYTPNIVFVVSPDKQKLDKVTPTFIIDIFNQRDRSRSLALYPGVLLLYRYLELPRLDRSNRTRPYFDTSSDSSPWDKIYVAPESKKIHRALLIMVRPQADVQFAPLGLPANWRQLIGPDGKLLPEQNLIYKNRSG